MNKYIWNSICSDRDKCSKELIQIKRSGQTLSHSLEVTGASHFSWDSPSSISFNKFAKPQVIKYE